MVRTYSTERDEDLSPGADALEVEAGMNRTSWNLRFETIPNIPGAYVFGSLQGRRVVPGMYQGRLTVGDRSMIQPLEVRMDPRVGATLADYLEQDTFVADVASELAEIHRSVARTQDVREQIEALLARLEGYENVEPISEAGGTLVQDLEVVADSLYQSKIVDGQTVINFPTRLKFQYVWLHGNANGANAGVSQGSRDVLRDLRVRWNMHRATVEELLSERLYTFNDMVRERGLSTVLVPLPPPIR